MLRALFQQKLSSSSIQLSSIKCHGLRFMSSLFSTTSSRKKFHNYHLRKRRKWPLSPYKTKWQQTFCNQLALEKLQESVQLFPNSANDFVRVLIDSFSCYECSPTPNAYQFIFRFLIKNPSNWDQIPKVLDYLQKDVNFETPEWVLIDLIKFYGDFNMLDSAIELFFNFNKFRCNPSVESLNTLLVVACKKKRGLEFVPEILMKSGLMNIRMEDSTFGILIRGLCRNGSIKFAIELVHFMVNEGYSLDESVYSLIVSKMCGRKGSDKAEILSFIEYMKKYGVSPRRVDWCNVIHYLVKNGTKEDALEVLNQMKMDGVEPNVSCYNMILEGFVEEGLYEEVDDLFDDMLLSGLVPDICTYNAYISALCKKNKLKAGVEMLASMEQLDCRPDIVTYNIILQAICMVGKLSMARELLLQMSVKGMNINMQTYEIIMGGMVSEGCFDDAYDFLKETAGNCSGAHSVALDEIVHAFCLRRSLDEALQVLNEMVQKNIAPGVRAWEALLEQAKISHGSVEISQVI
ncbi:hypothetical protein LIER_20074 [Lithospermum erythrorhizon]|uniref:Pentatricopeptide repeat-containing protein n=1 Tax=Lithospermum erythrorhizon TaxID=34254 RepID=A0AAV3QNS8_LITER